MTPEQDIEQAIKEVCPDAGHWPYTRNSPLYVGYRPRDDGPWKFSANAPKRVAIVYDAVKKTLVVNGRATAWNLDAQGRLGLHVFVDRVGLEIFSLDGLQYLPLPEIVPDTANRKLSWRATGAKKAVRDVAERAWRLKSAVR